MMSLCANQILTALPPEISFLLACARAQTDEGTAQRIREAAQRPLNWDRLIETSFAHGLMPLLYENLKNHCADFLPPDRLSTLKDLFLKNAARNVLLTGELLGILDLFAAEGIEAMPYKGPAIAVSIYGHLALRQFGDLDILVRKR